MLIPGRTGSVTAKIAQKIQSFFDELVYKSLCNETITLGLGLRFKRV